MSFLQSLRARWRSIAFALGIALAVSALYATGLRHQLIFDDRWAIDTPSILSSPISISAQVRSLWMPSFQAIFQWVGPELQWQRIFNISLHVANAWLLWVFTSALIYRALSQEATDATAEALAENQHQAGLVSIAVAAAVLFWVFNPMAVYGVQYLTQRSTVMATSFVLLGLWVFTMGLQESKLGPRLLWWCATGVSYALAVMSKEHAAPMVALLLPLYVFWQRPPLRQVWKVSAILLPTVAAAALWIVSRKGYSVGFVYEELAASFLQQLEAQQPGSSNNVFALSIINQLWLFWQYGALWSMPWPGWMSVDMRPAFPLVWHAFPQVLGPLLWVGAAGAALWALLRSRGRLALLGFLIMVPLVLTTTELVYVRIQEPFVLYRSYLWSIALPGVWAVALLYVFNAKQTILAAGLVLTAGLAAASYERIHSLYDESSAWRDALTKLDINAPPNVLGRWRAPLNISHADIVHRNYQDALRNAQLADKLGAPDGLAKFNAGTALFALGKPPQALSLLQAAQRDGYKGSEIWVSLAGVLEQLGRADEALSAYDQAVAGVRKPDQRVATLQQAARLANAKSQFDKSEVYYRQMLMVQPDAPFALVGVAYSLFRQGQSAKARDVLTEAINHRPLAEFFHARGMLFEQMGQRQMAMQDLAEAVLRDSSNPTYKAALRQLQAAPAKGQLGSPKK